MIENEIYAEPQDNCADDVKFVSLQENKNPYIDFTDSDWEDLRNNY